ncbi:hypothetical protein [Sulfobacillus thermosulfidooxidans]|jgi:hypothetical protein|uniref:hypothetical protein n=1 Tax=Sulfobacillus thermosulfidooxidans TaxID=28034 RepID=UPI0002F4DB11|nr:hypothetical protein [Sulfobacillus thermosulfidooxidans]
MRRVIFCGSRHWTDAVTIAHRLAQQRGLPTEVYPADWATYGRGAGPRRNAQMLATGVDAVYAFRLPGSSPGTDDMIRQARAAQIPVKCLMPEGRR